MSKLKRVLTIAVAFAVGAAAGAVLFRTSTPHRAGAVAPPEIILYGEPGFQGPELHLYGNAVDLPQEKLGPEAVFDWNDNVRSIIVVSGTWRLYQHGRLNTALDDTPREKLDLSAKAPAFGWSAVVAATLGGPLEIPTLEAAGIGTDISSVQLVSPENLPGWTCRLERR